MDYLIQKAFEYCLQSPYVTSPDIRLSMSQVIGTLLKADNIRQIIELPGYAAYSLKNRAPIGYRALELSIVIGISGWSTWMLADSLRDDEPAGSLSTSRKISLSFIFLQIMNDAIHEMKLAPDIAEMTASMIGIMEQANVEESEDRITGHNNDNDGTKQNHCLDIHDRTSGKSIAACIPLVALLATTGVSREDISLCIQFFTHFLHARQLSDDALDWRDDISAGRKTLITRWIHEKADTSDMNNLQEIFDQHVSIIAMRHILEDIERAHAAISRTSCFENVSCFVDIMEPYLRSVGKFVN